LECNGEIDCDMFGVDDPSDEIDCDYEPVSIKNKNKNIKKNNEEKT